MEALATEIRASVDPEAIDKVSRLFDATIRGILRELYQNARRSGAAGILVSMRPKTGTPLVEVTVADDGKGIEDPAVLLQLGRSAWDGADREDPAGMGIFALATTGATIESRAAGSSREAWRVRLVPSHFRGGAGARVDRIGREWNAGRPGTLVQFLYRVEHAASDAARMRVIQRAAEEEAEFLRTPVWIDGIRARQENFLKDAVRTVATPDGLIGIGDNRQAGGHARMGRRAVLHGMVAVFPQLPSMIIPRASKGLIPQVREALVTVVDLSDGKGDDPVRLTLPARDKVVWNEAARRVAAAAETLLYTEAASRIGSDPDLVPAHDQWAALRRAGHNVREPDPQLPRWHPAAASTYYADSRTPCISLLQGLSTRPRAMLVMAAEPDGLDAHALRSTLNRLDARNEGPLVLAERTDMAGYAWYDRLPRIVAVEVAVTLLDGTTVGWKSPDEAGKPDLPPGPVRAIRFELTVRDEQGERKVRIEGGAWIASTEAPGWSDELAACVHAIPDGPDSLPRKTLEIEIETATAREVDDERWTDQQEDERRSACAAAALRAQGDGEAAAIQRMRDAVANHVTEHLPDDRTATIRIGAGPIEIELAAREIETDDLDAHGSEDGEDDQRE